MPRCLMAKKWKAYPWPDRVEEPTIDVEEEEEIDVVGDTPAALAASGKATVTAASCWGPSSPTAGATAPSPPPHSPEATRGSTILYNGYVGHDVSPMHFTAYLPRSEHEVTVITSPTYATLHSPSAAQQNAERYSPPPPLPIVKQEITTQRKSLAMCYTSTGAALSLPPKKKDIYRPYSLDDRPQLPSPQSQQQPQPQQQPPRTYEMRIPAEEDLHAAHAILDLSASTAFLPPPPSQLIAQQSQQQILISHHAEVLMSPTPLSIYEDDENPVHSPLSGSFNMSNDSDQNENNNNLANINNNNAEHKLATGKTVAYTYEAFFVSDGRSKKKIPELPIDTKTKYTCTECGKQYATSSNLSRHKQTHRSLDSQAAKKCMTCGKAYVSMPALAMHVLTHKLAHSCGVCGKLFSRPWLLQGHLRSHTGEKPYGCAHCGKAFADRSNLRAHMQTHSIDKNFECQRCHKTFALKSYLNKHLESACFKDDVTNSHMLMLDEHHGSNSNSCSDTELQIIPSKTSSSLLATTNLLITTQGSTTNLQQQISSAQQFNG